MEQLEMIQFHHQSPQFVNQIPSDPFAMAALETAMMYVPEISAQPSQQSPSMENQINTGQQWSQHQEQQQEMFDDIVANTNPALAALPDAEQLAMANMYINPNYTFFNAKRNLIRASNSDYNFYGFKKNIASELDEQENHLIGFDDYDIDGEDLENFSDFGDDDDKDILGLFRRNPERDQDIDLNEVRSQRLRSADPSNSMLIHDYVYEDRRQLELENMHASNRSVCCGEQDEDIGLDSTISYSLKDSIAQKEMG